jgi:hypothetical protein
LEQFEGVSLIESRVFSNSDVFLRLIEFPRSRGSNLTSLRIFDEKSNAKPIDLSDSWGFEEVFFLRLDFTSNFIKFHKPFFAILSNQNLLAKSRFENHRFGFFSTRWFTCWEHIWEKA